MAVFVRRVEELEPGIYLPLRQPSHAALGRSTADSTFMWTRPQACPKERRLDQPMRRGLGGASGAEGGSGSVNGSASWGPGSSAWDFGMMRARSRRWLAKMPQLLDAHVDVGNAETRELLEEDAHTVVRGVWTATGAQAQSLRCPLHRPVVRLYTAWNHTQKQQPEALDYMFELNYTSR